MGDPIQATQQECLVYLRVGDPTLEVYGHQDQLIVPQPTTTLPPSASFRGTQETNQGKEKHNVE